MDETRALTRFCLEKYRRLLLRISAALLFATTYAIVVGLAFGGQWSWVDNIAGIALCVSFGSAAICSLVLFDYGTMRDLMAEESGCHPWVLRMPIKSWKIAMVPVVLKTLWIAVVWLLLLFTVVVLMKISSGRDFGYIWAWFATGVAVASASICAAAISWRPFSSGWWRLAAFFCAGVVCYGAFLFPVLVEDLDGSRGGDWIRSIKPYLPALSILSAIALYAVSVWSSIRSVSLAKRQSHGIVSERAGVWSAEPSSQSVRREHPSEIAALGWFYLARAKPWMFRSLAICIPGIVFWILFVPPHVVAIIVTFGWVLYTGAIGVSTAEGNHGGKAPFKTNMPQFIANSPLSTPTIAWTSLGINALMMVGCLSLSLLVFAGWACWPENREIWWHWASSRAAAVEMPNATLSIGARWSIAIVLGVNACLLCRWVSFVWVGYSGRESWTIAFGIGTGVLFLIVFGILIGWFMTNATSWDNVGKSAEYWIQFLPHLLGVWLVMKFLAFMGATICLIKTDLVSDRGIVRAMLMWLALVVGLALTMWLLIPNPRATLTWCLVATILTVPLARVLIVPVMLQVNRCR